MHIRSVDSICMAIASVVTCGLLAVGQTAAQEVAEAASAQASAPAVGHASLPVKPRKKGKVCEQEEVIGSRMKKRVCYMPEQWEARERAAKDFAREMDGKPKSDGKQTGDGFGG